MSWLLYPIITALVLAVFYALWVIWKILDYDRRAMERMEKDDR